MNQWTLTRISITNQFILKLVMLLLIMVQTSCSPSTDEPIKSLRIAVLPDRSADELKKRFNPLVEHLKNELDIEIEFVIVKDYQDLLNKFQRKEVDLVRFGGYSFINASINSGALPLVMRDVDVHFHSYFLVQADSTATTLEDYKGKRFSFGSKLSTSGHLMPRYFLSLENITPESYFSEVLYSGAHDKTAEWVKTAHVDLAVANAVIIDRLYQQGSITTEQVRILSRTPPYSDYVWAIQNNFPTSLKNKITEAFLKLSIANPNDKKILDAVGAKMYIPARQDDFKSLESIARQLKLITPHENK
ncbi:MAG: phosphate/phosphite/phosphonate ABC transporter substrate-binding protein [Methylococcaceae bacterium]|nr:phosphate/phosphite/phosphonate ABC transporter substrate-binding protein [Methylococcaceae bacterium]